MTTFTDEQFEGIDCPSTWKKETRSADYGSQTSAYTVVHRGIQGRRKAEHETQTEDFMYVEEDIRVEPDNSQELADHLRRIYPLLSDQLEKASMSRAFADDQDSWRKASGEIALKYILQSPNNNDTKLSVTSISWNCNGSVLAAAFGRFDHENWCVHPSFLSLWNLNKRQVDGTKPDFSFDVASCLMSVQFHPTMPSLLAAGSFTGELTIWDLSQEGTDNVLATSTLGESGHNEQVSQVLWLTVSGQRTGAGSRQKHRLVTVGLDGKILIWLLDHRKASLVLQKGLMVRADDLPRSVRVRGNRARELALTCAALSPHDPDTLVVGSDSGALFRCTLGTHTLTDNDRFDLTTGYPSPVNFTIAGQSGGLHSLHWSRFHRNLVIVGGASGCIQLYNMLQQSPVVTLEPGRGYLYAVELSPVRPTLLAGATADGHLVLHLLTGRGRAGASDDQTASGQQPLHTLCPSTMSHGTAVEGDFAGGTGDAIPQPITALQFNWKNPSLLAAGDTSGRIYVLALDESLHRDEGGEMDVLNQLFNVNVD